MTEIKIFPHGTPIKTKYSNIEGVIVACKIANKDVSYQVSYFHNGINEMCWLYDIEFSVTSLFSTKNIGFK